MSDGENKNERNAVEKRREKGGPFRKQFENHDGDVASIPFCPLVLMFLLLVILNPFLVKIIYKFYFFPSKTTANDVPCEEKFPKNFKDFDQLISKILINLEETENVFLNQAKAVLDRDLTLINWRFRLKALQITLQEKKQDFERIDQTVQCFWRMSSHIDDILCKLEKELPGPSLMENAFKYSPARMNMYDAMMKLSISQRDMMQQISSAVLSINEAIECNPTDPVEQFTRILSLHTEILRTIEIQAGSVEEKIKMMKTLQKCYANAKKPILCNSYY